LAESAKSADFWLSGQHVADMSATFPIRTLEKYYDVAVDLDGKEFVKIELDWDYENKRVRLSMAPYLQKALRQFENIVPTKRHDSPHDSPYPHIKTKYGAKQQYAEYDTSAPVGKDEQKHVQQVTGKFNWYARGVDGTLLTPISALSAQQAKPTQSTMKRVKQFLDYAATQEPAVTTYRASGERYGPCHSQRCGILKCRGCKKSRGGASFSF
jgi:hypothetical protein